MKTIFIHSFIHSFILGVSIAPLQVLYYSETLSTTAVTEGLAQGP